MCECSVIVSGEADDYLRPVIMTKIFHVIINVVGEDYMNYIPGKESKMVYYIQTVDMMVYEGNYVKILEFWEENELDIIAGFEDDTWNIYNWWEANIEAIDEEIKREKLDIKFEWGIFVQY